MNTVCKCKRAMLIVALFIATVACLISGCLIGLTSKVSAETTATSFDALIHNSAVTAKVYADGATTTTKSESYGNGQWIVQGYNRAAVLTTEKATDTAYSVTLTFNFADGESGSFILGTRLPALTSGLENQQSYMFRITKTGITPLLKYTSITNSLGSNSFATPLENGKPYVFTVTCENVTEGDTVTAVKLALDLDGTQVFYSEITDSSKMITADGYFGIGGYNKVSDSYVLVGTEKAEEVKPTLTAVDMDKTLEDSTNFTEVKYTGIATWERNQYTIQGQNSVAVYNNATYGNASMSVTANFNYADGENNAFLIGARGQKMTSSSLVEGSGGYAIWVFNNKIQIREKWTILSTENLDVTLVNAQDYILTVETYENADSAVIINFYIDGTLVASATDADAPLGEGHFGFASYQTKADSYWTIGVLGAEPEPEIPEDPLPPDGVETTSFDEVLRTKDAVISKINGGTAEDLTNGQWKVSGYNTAAVLSAEKATAEAYSVTLTFNFADGENGAFILGARIPNLVSGLENQQGYMFRISQTGIMPLLKYTSITNSLGSNTFAKPLVNGVAYMFTLVCKNVETDGEVTAVQLSLYLNKTQVFYAEITEESQMVTADGYFGVGGYNKVADSYVTLGVEGEIIIPVDPFEEPENLAKVDLDEALKESANFTSNVYADGAVSPVYATYADSQYKLAGSANRVSAYTTQTYGDASFSVTANFHYGEDETSAFLFVIRSEVNNSSNVPEKSNGYVIWLYKNKIQLRDAAWTIAAETSYSIENDKDYLLTFVGFTNEAGEGIVKFYIDGEEVLKFRDTESPITGEGYVGFSSYTNAADSYYTVGTYYNDRPEDLQNVDLNTLLGNPTNFTTSLYTAGATAPVVALHKDSQIKLQGVDRVSGYYKVPLYNYSADVTLTMNNATNKGDFVVALRAIKTGTSPTSGSQDAYLVRIDNQKVGIYRSWTALASESAYPMVIEDGQAYNWRFEIYDVDGNVRINVYVEQNGEYVKVASVLDTSENKLLSEGYIGFGSYTVGNDDAYLLVGQYKQDVVPELTEINWDELLVSDKDFVAKAYKLGAETEVKAEYVNRQFVLKGVDRSWVYYKEALLNFKATATVRFNFDIIEEQFTLLLRGGSYEASPTGGAQGKGYTLLIYPKAVQLMYTGTDPWEVGPKIDLPFRLSDNEDYELTWSIYNDEYDNVIIDLYINGENVFHTIDSSDLQNAAGQNMRTLTEGYTGFGIYTNSNPEAVLKIGKAFEKPVVYDNEFDAGRLLANGEKTVQNGVTVENEKITVAASGSAIYEYAKFENVAFVYDLYGSTATFVLRLKDASAGADGYVIILDGSTATFSKRIGGSVTTLATENISLTESVPFKVTAVNTENGVVLALMQGDAIVAQTIDSDNTFAQSGFFGVEDACEFKTDYDATVEDVEFADLMQNRDGWNGVELNALFMPNGTMTFAGVDAMVGYEKTYENFDLRFGYVVEENEVGWNGLYFRSLRSGEAWNGNTGYLLYFQENNAYLCSFINTDGVWEQIDLASVKLSAVGYVGQTLDMRLRVVNEGTAVRIQLYVNGSVRLDYLDDSENAWTEAGYFNFMTLQGNKITLKGTAGYQSMQPLKQSNPDTADSRMVGLLWALLSVAVVGLSACGGVLICSKKKGEKE